MALAAASFYAMRGHRRFGEDHLLRKVLRLAESDLQTILPI